MRPENNNPPHSFLNPPVVGGEVNRVTDNNRFDVNPGDPSLEIFLMSEDLSECLYSVYIDRTREMPDAVLWNENYYEVSDTTEKPPQYRKCGMVALAYETPRGTKHEMPKREPD